MTAASIMDPKPTVLKPNDRIRTAAGYIMQHRYRNLPVVDDQGRYMGIFGVNCLLRLVLPKAAVMEQGLDSLSFVRESLGDLHQRLRDVEDQPITLCLSDKVETVQPDTSLVESLLILYRTKASVPVVEPDTGKLVGMISYWDAGKHILSA